MNTDGNDVALDARTRTHRMRTLSALAIREEREPAPVGMEVRGERRLTVQWGGGDEVFRITRAFRRKEAARDDMADAFVAALTASQPLERLRTLPAVPEYDRYGLPAYSGPK